MRTIGAISSHDLPTAGRRPTPAASRPERTAAVPFRASWLLTVLHRHPGHGGARAVDGAVAAPRRDQPMPFC
ncbi:hypothetical protein [Amnibacterium soli]|uniref:hypothetical protein n=1 Tax=Amnibacterium soli TaxID=1282736 RepID=UPI0031E62776